LREEHRSETATVTGALSCNLSSQDSEPVCCEIKLLDRRMYIAIASLEDDPLKEGTAALSSEARRRYSS
jgi:hypothetical protein